MPTTCPTHCPVCGYDYSCVVWAAEKEAERLRAEMECDDAASEDE